MAVPLAVRLAMVGAFPAQKDWADAPVGVGAAEKIVTVTSNLTWLSPQPMTV